MYSLHNQPVGEDIITTFEKTQKQRWSKFHNGLCRIPIENCMEKPISGNPNELSDEDIPVFGIVPRLDNLMLVSCSKCSMVVKRDCLQYHYNRRHNDPKNDNFSLRSFVSPTVKINKQKKPKKINIRKIPEKKVTYSDSTDPIALENFQIKIKQENDYDYDSLKYYDDAGDFNLQSSSTSTINCNISDWTYKPHNPSLVHYADDILLNESIIEDADSKLIQTSTTELTIKKDLEPIICDKSSDPTNYENTIIRVKNSNELLTNSIDSSENTQNYNYMYSGFLLDDYDEIYNDHISSEIEYSKSSSYLDFESDTNAHNITGYNQHSTSSFGAKDYIKRPLCDKLIVSTPTSQYSYSDLIKTEFSGDNVSISDQQLITPVTDIKEEYTGISYYSNIVNNECSSNYSITCNQPPGITTTYNISETKSMSRNLDESFGISTKNQIIRCKSPLLLKNPVDVSSRIINTKRKLNHSPDYSQSTANIANKKIILTSNNEYLDLQTTLSPSYKFVYINDMSSIKPVNSYNQSLRLTLNQLKPVILNNETQKKLPSCNNSILNEFSEDKSDNDKTKYVQINKGKVVIDNDNAVAVADDEQYSKSVINVKDKLKYPLLTEKPGNIYDGISENEYFKSAFINNNKLQIPSLSSNVDSKYIPIIDYSDFIINNETDNFENELHDSELLIINQTQSACIPNSKDLDAISDGSSNNSVTSFDELPSVTSLDNDEIKLISRDCVSDNENSNDSVTSDDQLSTVSQDIKNPKLITQSDLILNHINYQQFINPATWTDESIIESLDVLNSKTECINCYNAAGDLLDNYFPVNSNTEIVDDFINSFTSDNSSVAITECPVKCSIPVNSNVQTPINYLSPVSSEAQIVKNTTSAKDNNSYYLSSSHTFKLISKNETNHTSFTNCSTHNCIIDKNVCNGNIVKPYSSEPYVDKPKQNENTLNRNTINGSNYINKQHSICKDHFKKITDKSIGFKKHCKIIPHRYNNIEARMKKRLHRRLEGQVVYDKENNNQLIARNLKKLKRLNFVMRKIMSDSDESDDNDNVNE